MVAPTVPSATPDPNSVVWVRSSAPAATVMSGRQGSLEASRDETALPGLQTRSSWK